MFTTLEDIAFRNSKSDLGVALEAFFQSMIDVRDKNPRAKTYGHRNQNADDMVKLFKKEVPTLTTVIKKHTGLILEKVHVIGGVDRPCTGLFAISTDPNLSTTDQLRVAYGRMSGTNHYSRKDYKKALSDLDALSANIDPKTGFYTGKVEYARNLTIELYFDVNLALCRNEFLPGDIEYTAAEITAIVLHELGHATTITQHLGDHYFSCLGGRDLIKNSLTDNKLTKKELMENIEQIQQHIEKQADKICAKDPEFAQSKTYGAFQSILRKIYDTVEDREVPEDESIFTTLGSGFRVMLIFFALIVNLIYDYWTYMFIWLIYDSFADQYATKNATGTKFSDVTTSRNNMYQIERWADEFATKHGYGAELTSALNKLHRDIIDFISLTGGSVDSANLRNSSMFGTMMRALGMFYEFASPLVTLDPIVYENQRNRAKRVRENIYGVFKNKNMDLETQNFWIEQLNLAERHYNEAKTWYTSDTMKILGNIFKTFASPSRLAKLLDDGNLHADFERLANNVDAMQNNALYSIAAQLR